MNISFFIIISCVFSVLRVYGGKTPTEQPGCSYNTRADEFYRAHARSMTNNSEERNNWICEKKFRSKLKVCIGVYRLLTNRRFDTAYEIKNEEDKHLISTECKKRNVTFHRQSIENSAYPTDNVSGLVTLAVDMFLCPIRKMDIKFKFSWKIFPPRRYDFYVTEGHGPGTVALLQDSSENNNICVINLFRPKQ